MVPTSSQARDTAPSGFCLYQHKETCGPASKSLEFILMHLDIFNSLDFMTCMFLIFKIPLLLLYYK